MTVSTNLLARLNNPSRALRFKALKELVSGHGRESVPHLRKFINLEKDDELLFYARRSLAILNKDIGREISGNDISDHEFIDIMYSNSSSAKIDVLKRIISLNRKKYINNIISILSEEKDPFVIATLIKTVGHIGNSSHINVITDFLQHNDARIRSNTIEALAMLGKNRGVEKLILSMLKDKNPRVRITAVNYLMTYTDETHMDDVIKKMAESRNISDKASVLFLIDNIPTPKYAGIVLDLSNDKNKLVSEKASRLLKKLNHIEEDEVNEFALLQKMESEKTENLETIEKKPEPDTFHALTRKLLETRQPDTLKKTIIKLERLGDTRAIPYIEKIDSESKVVTYFKERSLQKLRQYSEKVLICPNCGYQMRKEDE